MKAKKIWANFSVQNADRTREFYTQLGFAPSKQDGYPKLASFLFGADELVIHFFEQGSKIDEYLPPEPGTGSEIIFTLAAETEAEVKAWEEQVKNAGGKILKAAGRDEANYYGFVFADPDGHKFNVLLMEAGM